MKTARRSLAIGHPSLYVRVEIEPTPDQRVSLLTLDTAGKPTVGGTTYTYEMMHGTLTADGEKVFAGFYPPPDNVFGCVSVTFTTP